MMILDMSQYEDELAEYIADYVKEEIARGNEITADTIINAIEAYEGGAR